jgi:RNA polymerase sporulation-specific sigma factor
MKIKWSRDDKFNQLNPEYEGTRKFVGYLNNNIFPSLLTEEEESRYLHMLEDGNKDARNILIEHNLRLVAHICKKFENTGFDKDDLISIGTIGLIKGINTFSCSKGTRLATYAARCIENEILMYLRATKNQKSEVSLSDPVGMDKEGNEVTLLDLLGSSGEEICEEVELREESSELWKHLDKLPKREKYVICLRYGLGNLERKTQREIAKHLGISRSYVSETA